MDALAHAALQGAFLRLVVPMRREFGMAVDVPRMREDRAYAQFVVTRALTGQAPTLREAAAHIDGYLQAAAVRDAALVRTSALSAASLPA
jgi:hypothetical protein